ncbi:HAMP domain-containing protein [Oscillochloris sp. ZM17-4]|uniref:sensor histidine kinase n=1 Tax=Oscillochloris sp. ZM17-4 TaxID=2866714 RepID=UPI001C732ED6|nr:ATP-binding protein [Oscillochloris sp. ZM17-4]MBX0326085.1 HAMP domain-containing protein [Oscillochloris sp. ZM17-4]
MLRFHSSIQQRILLLLLGLSLPPLLLVGWLGLTGLSRARETAVDAGISSLQRQAESTLAQRAHEKAQLYDASLRGVQQQVESVAGYAEGLAGDPTPAPGGARVWVAPAPSPALLARYAPQVAYTQRIISLLQAVVSRNPLVSIGYVALEQGGVIAFDKDEVIDKLLEIQPFDPRQRPWYMQASAAGATVWTDAYVDANTGALATTCATPIYDAQGGLIGVVAFDLLLSTIQQDLLTVDIGENGYAFMLNTVGDVIVRPDLSAENARWNEPFRSENLLDSPSENLRALAQSMIDRNVGIEQMDYNGQPTYIAYEPIPSAGWSVGLVIPADNIIQPALDTGQIIGDSQDALRTQLIILLVLIAAIIAFASVLLSHSFTRPIRALQQGVRAVAGGQLDQRLPRAGQDEIGELVDAFNVMTGALQEKVAELEANASQLATLNIVSNELKGILDLPELLGAIPDTVCARFGFDRTALYLVEGNLLKVVGASFGPGNALQASYFMEVANASPLRLDGGTVEADVVRSGKAVIVDDPWNHPRVEPRKQAASASHSYVQVPIVGRDDRVIGLLSADYHLSQRSIQPQDASQLLMFANMVGLTIQNVQLYTDLERQVAQRTEELRAALDRAQLADRRKSDFLTGISHELRTPLNAIIGFSTVLIDDLDGPLTPIQREDAQSINRNGRFLLHLINELLDLSRIEAGHLDLDLGRVDLRAVVGEVVDTVQALLRDREVSLNHTLPVDLPPVRADADRVRQIMLNLLSNAVKFTERGTITVSATTLDELSEAGEVLPYVIISVRDTGIGIPADRQRDIFEEFVQIHGRQSRRRGTGLGLAIVRKLVEAHHGRIWVESALSEGSTFSFTLPILQGIGNSGQGTGSRQQSAESEPPAVPLLLSK